MKRIVSMVLIGALMLTGLVFLCLSMFREPRDTKDLPIALACITVSNLLNILRVRMDRKKEESR